MSRYRCREHPDQPVTWRGTGCKPCADDADQRRRALIAAQRGDVGDRVPERCTNGPRDNE